MKSQRPSDSLARGTTLGFLAEALILPTGLVSAAVLTRSLGPEGYGLVGVAMAVISPVAWVLTSVFGLRSSVKIIADADAPIAAASALLRVNILIGIVGAAIFALFAPLTATILERPEIIAALMIGALDVLLMPVARSHRDALLGTKAYSRANLAGGVFHVVRLVAVIVLLVLGVGIETVMWAHVAGRLAEIAWCRWHLPVPLRSKHKLATLENARIVGPTFANAIALRIADSVDLLVLSALGVATHLLGHYSAAMMVALIPRMLNLVLGPGLIMAHSSAIKTGDHALAAQIREDTSRLLACVAAVVLAGVGAAPTIMLIIFGPAFVEGADILRCLLMGGVFMLIFGVTTSEFVAENRPWAPFAISLPMVGLLLVLLFVLVPMYGVLGAAASTASAFVFCGLASLALMHSGRSVRLRHLCAGLLAGLVGGGVAAGLAARQMIVIDGLAGIGVAAFVLGATGVLDRRVIERLVRSNRSQREAEQ